MTFSPKMHGKTVLCGSFGTDSVLKKESYAFSDRINLMIKAAFRFFSGILKIVIGVVVALIVFSILLSKGCEHGMAKHCEENPGAISCNFVEQIRK